MQELFSGSSYRSIYTMNNKGFTLLEVLIATAIILMLGLAWVNFSMESVALNRSASERLNSEFESRRALARIVKELRQASALNSTSTLGVSFAADLDGDDSAENVRFFVEGDSLKREGPEGIITLINNLENGSSTPLFSWDGRFVTLTIQTGGREHSVGITLRNQ